MRLAHDAALEKAMREWILAQLFEKGHPGPWTITTTRRAARVTDERYAYTCGACSAYVAWDWRDPSGSIQDVLDVAACKVEIVTPDRSIFGRCQGKHCPADATMEVEIGSSTYYVCLRHLNEARAAFEGVLVG